MLGLGHVGGALVLHWVETGQRFRYSQVGPGRVGSTFCLLSDQTGLGRVGILLQSGRTGPGRVGLGMLLC